jgi:hypothetical protein
VGSRTTTRCHLTRVVIVDGYDSLLHEQPETLAELELLMRVGRSRGIHVVLACQQLTVGRSDRLVDNATARTALRTVTEQCSRDVIGTSEAAHLPHTPPGLGLYVGTPGDTPIGFQSLTTPRSLVRSTAAQLLDDQRDPAVRGHRRARAGVKPLGHQGRRTCSRSRRRDVDGLPARLADVGTVQSQAAV